MLKPNLFCLLFMKATPWPTRLPRARSNYPYRTNAFELHGIAVAKNVRFWVGHDLEGDSTVVVL